MSTIFTTAILATVLFVSSTIGHSQMRCAKYNPQNGQCDAPIRDAGESFAEEAHDMTTGNGLCQKPMSNPITAAYSNGPACGYATCPQGMGTFTPGENFYVQWVARNHAVQDQTPGNISLYLSPAESVNQGQDVTADVFGKNKFCTAPFMSCNGQNGDLVPCYAPCTFPSNVQSGIYTIWWKWTWLGHTSIYSTCADIYVSSSGSTPSTPAPTSAPTPAPTAAPKPAPTPAPTSAPTPAPTPAPTSAPVPSSNSCPVAGYEKCLTSETYSMCNAGTWGPAQSCATGTQCSPTNGFMNGNYIYCKVPNAPSSPTPTPSTPSSTSSPTSDSCTDGYQKCSGSGSSTYQTCFGGKWATAQSCQAGLTCHNSQTSNNIYCY